MYTGWTQRSFHPAPNYNSKPLLSTLFFYSILDYASPVVQHLPVSQRQIPFRMTARHFFFVFFTISVYNTKGLWFCFKWGFVQLNGKFSLNYFEASIWYILVSLLFQGVLKDYKPGHMLNNSVAATSIPPA